MFTVRFSLGLKHLICNFCLHWQKTNTTEFLTPTHTYTWTRQEGTVKETWENQMEGCISNFIVPMTKHYDQGNLWKEGHFWLMVHNGGAEVAGCRWHEQQLRAHVSDHNKQKAQTSGADWRLWNLKATPSKCTSSGKAILPNPPQTMPIHPDRAIKCPKIWASHSHHHNVRGIPGVIISIIK